MTADQRFSLLLIFIGLMFTMLSAVVALLWRAGTKTGQVLEQIRDMQDDILNNTKNLDAHMAWHLARSRPR